MQWGAVGGQSHKSQFLDPILKGRKFEWFGMQEVTEFSMVLNCEEVRTLKGRSSAPGKNNLVRMAIRLRGSVCCTSVRSARFPWRVLV